MFRMQQTGNNHLLYWKHQERLAPQKVRDEHFGKSRNRQELTVEGFEPWP